MSAVGEPPLATVDAAARDRARGLRAEDRRGRLLIEAAAGSGKTTVLVDRALAYVDAGEHRLDRLAIVTFTELAALELKLRLRQKVGERLAAAPDESARRRWSEALGDLERAAVGTIHAFCIELLRQRPVEAQLDPGFAVADPLRQRLLFDEAWESFLVEQPVPEEAILAATDLDLLSSEKLRDAAFRLAELRVEVEPAAPPPAFAQRFADACRGLATIAQAGLRSAHGTGALKETFGRAITELDKLQAREPRQRQSDVLAAKLEIPRNVGLGRETEAKARRDEWNLALAELRAALYDQRLRELGVWLQRVGDEYQGSADAQGYLDFDQQLLRTRALLHAHPEVCADFRRRFPVLLVDEFQDTDAVQTDILLALAGPPSRAATEDGPRAFVAVGDPKQSIYRFRGADLENYHRVREREIPVDAIVTLGQSFRPLPALAEFVNRVSERVLAPAGGPLAPWEARFEPMHAIERPAPPGSGVVHLELEAPEESRVAATTAREAEAFARLLKSLPREDWRVRDPSGGTRPLRLGDVAILLPTRGGLEEYENALHDAGIRFRTIGGRHYFRRDEVHALLGVLRALADPGDPVATIGALRGPACGCSDHDLLAYALAAGAPRLDLAAIAGPDRLRRSPEPAAAERCAAGLRTLVELRRAVLPLPLGELVAEVLDRTGLLPFYALHHRGEQRAANLARAVEIARQVEEAGVEDLPSLVRWIEDLIAAQSEEGDSPFLEDDAEVVRLLTVHMAKGLEFPAVLLGGLAAGERREDGLRALQDAAGHWQLGLKKDRGTRGWAAAQEREEAREDAERRRLLYVALTRAKDLLLLPFLPEAATRWSAFARLLYGTAQALPGAFGARSVAVASLPELPPPVGRHSLDLAELQPELGEEAAARRAAWAGTARPALRPGVLRPSAAAPAPPAAPLPPVALAAIARRRRIGSAAHARIAAALRGGARVEPGRDLDPAERTESATLAERFLASPLGQRARAAAERLVEEPLTVALSGGGLLDGQLDLAFVDDGSWVVVDYKAGRPDRGDRYAERLEGYRRQVRLYAEALQRLSGRAVAERWLFFLAEGTAEPVGE